THIVKEITALKKLSHRHLVKFLGSYTDDEYIAYLMEPVADCNLLEYIANPGVPDLLALRYSYGCLAGAVNYLHSQRIRHRDIATRNILVKDGRVFLSDFGNAYIWTGSKRSTTNDRLPVSEEYMAPEVAKREPRNRASDMWSLGVVFLEV
ncbi:kinase-like protein, partial [Rhizodiscina lignyota]